MGKTVVLAIILSVLFLGSSALNYYISNHSNQNDSLITILKINYNISLIWVLYIIIFIITISPSIYSKLVDPFKNKIKNQEKLIEEQKQLLISKAGSLMDKYNDLQQYQEKETLLKYLSRLTSNNSFIHSSQLYSYTKNIYNESTTIKVTYVNGSASEQIDINAIVQGYYNLPNDIYLKINNILQKNNKLNTLETKKDFATLEIESEIEENIKNDIESKISDFIDEYYPKIKDKELKELDELDSYILALLELCFEVALKISNESEEDIQDAIWSLNLFDDETKNIFLREIKRTGILTGILKVNEHIFRNEGNSNKKGRIYITRCFKLNGQDYIILLSIFPNIVDYPNWEELISKVCNDFVDEMNRELNVLYNNDV